MQKLQDSIFSILKTTSLSPAVFSFLQPTEDFAETPLGGILQDTKHGWLALGPKFCVVDLRNGLKVAAKTFGNGGSHVAVTSVIELPHPLTNNSQQLVISLDVDDTGLLCVLHVNGSQILRCIQSDVVITELALCDDVTSGPFTCFDGLLMAGTQKGEVLVIDFNRSALIQALKDITQGNGYLIKNESNPANLSHIPLKLLHKYKRQGELSVNNDEHLTILLNEDSFLDSQFIFRNPDGTVRMKANNDHVRVTVIQYIPQLGTLAVGYNFGAFQLWNILDLALEFTSQVNVECLPVTHFGFQEPCDDPRAFCYLWVVFSVTDRFDEHEFPLAVMYSLTYQGKRILVDNKCLYQEFSSATIRFQVELGTMGNTHLVGGRCISTHTFSINTMLGEEGEDTMLNLCQLVWECWGERATSSQYGMLLFDLDQWYKDQMPATYQLQSNTFMSTAWCSELGRGCLALDLRLDPGSLSPYSHATRLEEHFYPNSLQYNCVCLNTSEAIVLHTVGIQRQIISSISSTGPSCLLSPGRLYTDCMSAGLLPAYRDQTVDTDTCVDEQRKFLLSVALEARMSQFLKRCAQDWATGTHTGVGCSLTFLVDWAWKRAIELKENAKELISPLFTSATLPERNVIRCLEHCVQQLSQLTGLLDAILTKCCNLIVPDALSEIEEKYKGIGTVSLYFQVIQWFLRVGLLPERNHPHASLPYPAEQLYSIYKKRASTLNVQYRSFGRMFGPFPTLKYIRYNVITTEVQMTFFVSDAYSEHTKYDRRFAFDSSRAKLHRIQGDTVEGDPSCVPSPLLYVDQLIVNEFGGHNVHQIWIRAGSECGGLYPPPSLYALLRLYLLPDISEEHKHSLLLYLLFDYSMIYDDAQYEAVIRRLMQFPPMFGLSTTVVRATQAFWHLDHRDFHFALDQLQCLTGNTLSDWRHQVVLSSLLAQKKSQAALQYLHVRKPAPIQNVKYKNGDSPNNAVNGHDKLEDWQSCCDLYLDRGLVFEALDVVRMCVRNAGCAEDKTRVLNYFFKGCRNSGQLSKVLQVSLLPFEEEVFIRYLRECDEPQAADILIMYYLQQARYLEAEQYNKQIKSKSKWREMCQSAESVADVGERRAARDVLVDLMCGFVPRVAGAVARLATSELEPHVLKPKPMSFYVKPMSPKNTFTYKSSFIQDTIENASETWINKPKMKKGLKRALNIDETPFICTPKLYKTKSISEQRQNDSTPAKRARLNLSPKTPRGNSGGAARVSRTVSDEIATLLDMPDVQSPRYKSSRPETPHSILKTRRLEYSERDVMSPMESRYLGDSDEEMETASINTHFSDSTNKHLRFTIPTPTVVGSTPSPVPVARHTPTLDTIDHGADTQAEEKPIESPPKKFAAENYPTRKSYKDSVRARRSLSISANSSLSDDPNTSIESIADIPVTLINPKYSGERRGYTRTPEPEENETNREFETQCYSTGKSDIAIRLRSGVTRTEEVTVFEGSVEMSFAPKTPKGRRSIRSVSESTPNMNRSHSGTPERHDSPVVTTPLRSTRNTRSRSRTPEVSPRTSPLPAIPEMPKLELDSESHPTATMLSIPAPLRSRSRTPERIERVIESPRLEVIKESPTKQDSPTTRSNLRSRSRTPEVEVQTEQPIIEMPRSLRSRSKTPEKLMSPKKDVSKHKKSLSRIVLEANTFAKTKQIEKMETEVTEEKSENIECTPMKPSKQMSSVMDVTFSPIFNKSVLQSSHESILSITTDKMNTDDENSTSGLKLPAFTSLHEVYTEESVLHSYQSSIAETSNLQDETKNESAKEVNLPMFTTFNEDIGKSVLHSYESSIDTSAKETENKIEELPKAPEISLNETEIGKSVLGNNSGCINVNESSLMTSDSEIEIDKGWKTEQDSANVIQKEKEKIVEIEREIHEIEGDLSDDDCRAETDSGNEVVEVESPEESEGEVEDEEESSEEEETSEESVVISINDSDSDSEQLQIDEQQDNMQLQTQEAFTITEQSEKAIDHEILGAEEVIEDGEVVPQEIIEINVKDNENAKQNEVSGCTAMSTDSLNVAHMSMLTDDNSVIESEQSISLNYSEEIKAAEKHALDIEQDRAVAQIVVDSVESLSKIDPSTMVSANECQEQNKDEEKLVEVQSEEKMDEGKQNEEKILMESVQSVKEKEKRDENVNENQKTTNEIENKIEASEQKMEIDENAREAPVDTPQVQDQEKVEKEVTKEMNVEIATPRTRRRKSTLTDKTSVDVPETITETVDEDIEKPKPRTRRQSSNKIDEAQEPEPKTPRKKTESTSEKPETIPETIPETPEIDSPRTRRRSKTPNTEVRRILTRRASRELSEKDDELMPLEELTPRRRTRANSKKDDDTASVASDSSVKSGLSKASEEEKGIRKGRKTLLSTKTDLTVIPETPAEDSTKNSEDIDEYSTARRVTRHQKAVLERTPVRAKGRRVSHDEDSRQSFEAQPSEPETLLDKTDSEVPLDPDDYQNSPDSLPSSASKYRGRRAASETKSVKAARIGRRTSVDVVVAGSGSEAGSPTRGRRASFTRACQAIHTPKGRRTSTDIKKGEIDSNPASPATSEASGTPARRSSRRTSTQSLTGTPEPGKRTRKGAEKNQDKE